jgi:hypothetical protein
MPHPSETVPSQETPFKLDLHSKVASAYIALEKGLGLKAVTLGLQSE